MKTNLQALSLVFCSIFWLPWLAPGHGVGQTLLIGTKETAPFAMQDDQNQWHGISIDLWQRVASALELDYEFREMEFDTLIASVQNGALDAAIAAFTLTAEREKIVDFSHPYYTTGLGIAVTKKGGGLFYYARKILSPGVLQVIFSLSILLFLIGLVVWLLERKRNPQQFGGGVAAGLMSGFWWSAVTMTTVGYGDKAPQSVGGRIIALVWMFTGLIMISSFTATITSQLTVSQLADLISGPEDLHRVSVSTVAGSTSAAYLQKNRISHRTRENISTCLKALAEGDIQAVVYDEAILLYMVISDFADEIEVLPKTFARQQYGIVLPQDSDIREAINQALLKELTTPYYQDILFRYLGE
jgi:ABC-type amino acid transport substrate-binding protein